MRTSLVIAQREFKTFFTQPVAYVALAVFLVITGAVFFFVADFYGTNQASLRVFFEWTPVVFIVFLPAVSMRLIAEERRSGTFEMLITMPVRDVEVAFGKLLGAVFFLITALASTLVYPIMVSYFGNPDMGPILGGYFGLLLIGTAYLAIGLMASAWTDNQIVALIIGAMICAFFYFVDSLIGGFWREAQPVLAYISFKAHFQNIARGVIDTRDIIFYLSVIVVAVLAAAHSLGSRKWK